MFADGFADHLPKDRVLVGTDPFPHTQVSVIRQLDLWRLRTDLSDPPVALIGRVTTRKPLKVIAMRGSYLPLGIRTVLLAAHQLQLRLERVTGHSHELDVGLGRTTQLLSVRDHDGLYQVQLVRIQRIKAIHHVAGGAMGR